MRLGVGLEDVQMNIHVAAQNVAKETAICRNALI